MSTRTIPTRGLGLLAGALVATLIAAPTSTAATDTGSDTLRSADLTRAQAIAVARAGVARAKDAPKGYKVQVRSLSARKKDLRTYRKDEASFFRCLGYAPPVYLARAFGPKLIGKQAEIVTTADVTRSARAARNTMAALHDERGTRCYEQRLANALRRNNLDGDVVVKQVAFSVPGADETYAYNSTLTIRGKQGTQTIEAILVGSRIGQVITTVSFSVDSRQGVSGKTIQKTAAKPVKRVRQELARQS